MNNFNETNFSPDSLYFTITERKDSIIFMYSLMILLPLGLVFTFIYYPSFLVIEVLLIWCILYITIAIAFSMTVFFSLTVNQDTISIKRFMREKSYLTSQVHKINFTNRGTYVLYVENKKIGEVSVLGPNIMPFLDWLSQLNLDVYVNNELVETDSIKPEVLQTLRLNNKYGK